MNVNISNEFNFSVVHGAMNFQNMSEKTVFANTIAHTYCRFLTAAVLFGEAIQQLKLIGS